MVFPLRSETNFQNHSHDKPNYNHMFLKPEGFRCNKLDSKKTHGVLCDVVHGLYRGVLYIQNGVRL